jgi:aspartokinase
MAPISLEDDLGQPKSSDGWIVQKFGGTSLGKFVVKIVEDIIK